ncbi:OLC1v1007481C1 [Oldenlandia corymbosa var. corymbosa]|uniref:OLC1v1007481C1 n=1 Tax=Oldenlandia corymbosa var. corymbosa TaxID=529605 RepID=A0AAV1DM40_OLDCO|nr:OLC1v1007481C1 [Oldenlandia corymbosa var. corymbosa]
MGEKKEKESSATMESKNCNAARKSRDSSEVNHPDRNSCYSAEMKAVVEFDPIIPDERISDDYSGHQAEQGDGNILSEKQDSSTAEASSESTDSTRAERREVALKNDGQPTAGVPAWLPDDILHHLIATLPADQIGRLSCVQKAWRNLPRVPHIITTQLSFARFGISQKRLIFKEGFNKDKSFKQMPLRSILDFTNSPRRDSERTGAHDFAPVLQCGREDQNFKSVVAIGYKTEVNVVLWLFSVNDRDEIIRGIKRFNLNKGRWECIGDNFIGFIGQQNSCLMYEEDVYFIALMEEDWVIINTDIAANEVGRIHLPSVVEANMKIDTIAIDLIDGVLHLSHYDLDEIRIFVRISGSWLQHCRVPWIRPMFFELRRRWRPLCWLDEQRLLLSNDIDVRVYCMSRHRFEFWNLNEAIISATTLLSLCDSFGVGIVCWAAELQVALSGHIITLSLFVGSTGADGSSTNKVSPLYRILLNDPDLIGDAIEALASNPAELAMTRMQGHSNHLAFHALHHTASSEGILALWKGACSGVLRTMTLNFW